MFLHGWSDLSWMPEVVMPVSRSVRASSACRQVFSRRFATLLRGFAAQFCSPQREKTLWHPG